MPVALAQFRGRLSKYCAPYSRLCSPNNEKSRSRGFAAYHEIGRLIHEHILASDDRAAIASEVIADSPATLAPANESFIGVLSSPTAAQLIISIFASPRLGVSIGSKPATEV
jgi:hypothetical protein